MRLALSEAPATAPADGGWPVSVVNPLRVKGFCQSQLQRNKTDSADAGVLAQFYKLHTPKLWTAPSLQVRQLRGLVDRLPVLKDIALAEGRCRQPRLQINADNAVLKVSIQSHLDRLGSCMKALQKQIDDHIDAHPDLAKDAALLASIPGLGTVTVAKVLGCV